ncbi:hypothetical protein [Phenylobacterium immobile]|uniref:hypothetical protein n=1 Tax=Phenylobacterium immobile TaxID=21 RepID=UPI0011466FE9|nr:hypothetical protein [Phenylobacterium immobile]
MAAADNVVNLDAALLGACSGEERDQLLGEAVLLADAFAPDGGAPELLAMAQTLKASPRGDPADRRHARKLAAALQALAVNEGAQHPTTGENPKESKA